MAPCVATGCVALRGKTPFQIKSSSLVPGIRRTVMSTVDLPRPISNPNSHGVDPRRTHRRPQDVASPVPHQTEGAPGDLLLHNSRRRRAWPPVAAASRCSARAVRPAPPPSLVSNRVIVVNNSGIGRKRMEKKRNPETTYGVTTSARCRKTRYRGGFRTCPPPIRARQPRPGQPSPPTARRRRIDECIADRNGDAQASEFAEEEFHQTDNPAAVGTHLLDLRAVERRRRRQTREERGTTERNDEQGRFDPESDVQSR